jgi:hypothetical protein
MDGMRDRLVVLVEAWVACVDSEDGVWCMSSLAAPAW